MALEAVKSCSVLSRLHKFRYGLRIWCTFFIYMKSISIILFHFYTKPCFCVSLHPPNNSVIHPSCSLCVCMLWEVELPEFDVHGFVHLGNIYIYIHTYDCKSDDMHTEFLYILYYTILALQVSGTICTHHQEHKLQSTAVGTCD
jgi:hypothetical protein